MRAHPQVRRQPTSQNRQVPGFTHAPSHRAEDFGFRLSNAHASTRSRHANTSLSHRGLRLDVGRARNGHVTCGARGPGRDLGLAGAILRVEVGVADHGNMVFQTGRRVPNFEHETVAFVASSLNASKTRRAPTPRRASAYHDSSRSSAPESAVGTVNIDLDESTQASINVRGAPKFANVEPDLGRGPAPYFRGPRLNLRRHGLRNLQCSQVESHHPGTLCVSHFRPNLAALNHIQERHTGASCPSASL